MNVVPFPKQQHTKEPAYVVFEAGGDWIVQFIRADGRLGSAFRKRTRLEAEHWGEMLLRLDRHNRSLNGGRP